MRAEGQRVERLVRLFSGLGLFGLSIACMVRARLGLGPWDVLHQGIAERLDVQIGWVVIGVGALAMLAWVPLRVRPGFGTLSNLILVGLAANVALDLLGSPDALVLRALLLAGGIGGMALSTALYIGAGLGPGPRDGLMTGLAARGLSLRVVRTGLEVSVLIVGWLLGGSVGIGTIAFAFLIGPLVHVLLPRLAIRTALPSDACEDAHGG
jgi:uncharacterized membrane protein YczE